MISIIVPVYNAEAYLDKCVDCLVNQTFKDIEIVLVDDGAKDRSGQMCDEYALKDSRIKVVHKPNGGLVSAWKAGVKESTGDRLCFVDSDDWIDTNMIEEFMKVAGSSDKEILVADAYIERMKGDGLQSEYVSQGIKAGKYDKADIKENIIPRLLGNETRYITFSRCVKLISRKLIEDNMKYADESLKMAEDMSVMVPALMDCESLAILDRKAYYHYLYVEESMVHAYDKTAYSSMEKAVEMIGRALEDKFEGEKLEFMKNRLDKEHIFLLLLAVKNEARGNPSGYRKNILKIYNENEELINNTEVEIGSKSNKLLYRALKKPSFFNLSLLRLAIKIYYR